MHKSFDLKTFLESVVLTDTFRITDVKSTGDPKLTKLIVQSVLSEEHLAKSGGFNLTMHMWAYWMSDQSAVRIAIARQYVRELMSDQQLKEMYTAANDANWKGADWVSKVFIFEDTEEGAVCITAAFTLWIPPEWLQDQGELATLRTLMNLNICQLCKEAILLWTTLDAEPDAQPTDGEQEASEQETRPPLLN